VHACRPLAHYSAYRVTLAVYLAILGSTALPDDTGSAVAALTRARFSLTFVDDKPIEATKHWGDLQKESLSHLGRLDDLRHLTIRSGDLDDSAVESIAAIKNLTRLRLTGKLTDEGISRLARLDQLRTLDLRRTEITSDGLSVLGELRVLVELILAGTIADSKHVPLFPRLRVLNLAGDQTHFPNADFAAISQLQELQILDLSGNKTATDIGMTHLGAIKHLRSLLAADTDITDACIDSIMKLKSLQSLDVKGTQITKEGVARLEQGLPQCLIRR
jgi:Leucine-rich repeat (LRR) protein